MGAAMSQNFAPAPKFTEKSLQDQAGKVRDHNDVPRLLCS